MFAVVRWQAYATGALLVLALVAGIWGHGWNTGRTGTNASWEARVTALRVERTIRAAQIAGQAQVLLQIAEERNALAEQLEREAHEDSDADRPAFGRDAIMRLNRR